MIKTTHTKNLMSGITLLEILIVVGLLAIIAVAGTASFRGFGKSVELNSTTSSLVSDIQRAQAKAQIAEGGFKWGVRLVNSVSNYYLIYSTPTNFSDPAVVITSTTTFPSYITFSDPTFGSVKDIIFSKIAGTTTATTTSLFSESSTKIIDISSIGTVGAR